MRALADGIWVVEEPLRFMGLPIGRRMTVVRLGGGDLFIHSPAPLNPQLRAALDDLGAVRFVAAASAIHGHLSMGDYRAAYPDAELLAPPGLDRRRKDLAFDGLLGDVPDPRWASDLDQAAFAGHLAPEILFLHRASRTLVVGDLVWNVGADAPVATRLVARLAGFAGRPAPTPIFRLATRNRAAARRSAQRVLAWDFDRIVPGHGAIAETGGREALRRALEWL